VVVAAKPQVIPKPKFILVGVFVNSDAGVAVVQKPGTDKQIRLAPGDSIDGWEVMSILPDRITLRSQQETHEVELRKAGSARRP
jgi:type II secretory pathway component PulC